MTLAWVVILAAIYAAILSVTAWCLSLAPVVGCLMVLLVCYGISRDIRQ